MMTKDQVRQMREGGSDSSTFNSLLNADQEFKTRVERVRSGTKLSPFEEKKFPSTMLDFYLEKERGGNDDTARVIDQGMKKQQQMKQSALGQLSNNPLSFAGETLGNVLPSAFSLAKDLGSAVAHPFQTAGTLGQLVGGGAVNTLETIANMAGVRNAESIFNFESEEIASAVGNLYAERYGGLENAAKTLRDDPIGFLSDLGALVTGVGGALKGGATAVGAATGAATRSATVLSRTGKAVRATQAVGSNLIKTGIHMEPIVIAGKGVIKVGGAVGISSEKIMSSTIKLKPHLNKKFQRSTVSGGETPAQYALRKGVTGKSIEQMAEQFGDISRVSKESVDSFLSTVKETYDIVEDVPRVHDVLQKILAKYDTPTGRVGNEAVIAHVKNLLEVERMNLTEINGVKRMIDDAFNLFKRDPTDAEQAAIEAMQGMRFELQGFIEDQARIKGNPDIGLLNKDTQLSRFMQNALEDSATSKYGNNILSLTDTIIGSSLAGGGFALGSGGVGFFAAAGVLLTKKVLGSVRFRTTFAKYLSRLSPKQRAIMRGAAKTGRHTKESRSILKRVTTQTAEDIKNKKIGESEAIPSPNRVTPESENRLLRGQETLPNDTPPASNLSTGENRTLGLTGSKGGSAADDLVKPSLTKPSKAGGKTGGSAEEFVANKLGGDIFEYKADGLTSKAIKVKDNTIRYQMFDQSDQILVSKIFIDEKGTGLGTKFVDSLKELSDNSGKKLVINHVENPKFFDKFDYLKNERGAYRYNPTAKGGIPKELEGLASPHRKSISKPRNGWTLDRIKQELKTSVGHSDSGERLWNSAIDKFETPKELQGNLFFHGTGESISKGLKPSIALPTDSFRGGGRPEDFYVISLSKSKNIASNFTGGTARTGTVYPVILKKDAKVITMKNIQDANELEDILPKLWEDGVDAVKIGDWNDGFSEQELAVLNPRSIVKGKGQSYPVFQKEKFVNPSIEELTDIFNQAQ